MTKDLKLKLMSKMIANIVRNTPYLEGLHGGKSLDLKRRNCSKTKVITPEKEILWKEVSRISQKEMKELIKDIERNVFLLLKITEKQFKIEFDKEFLEKLEETQREKKLEKKREIKKNYK